MVPPSFPQPLDRPPGGGRPGRLPGPQGPGQLVSGNQLSCPSHLFGLSATPASVGLARRTVDELLIAWGVRAVVRDNAVVVTSELVTNALTHSASDWIVCEVRITDGVLRIEVEDQNRGPTLPVPGRPGPDDQGGRGLLLVTELSSDWGTADVPHRSGRIVWAELATDSDEPVPP